MESSLLKKKDHQGEPCYELLTDDSPNIHRPLPQKPAGFFSLDETSTNVMSTKEESFINLLTGDEANELDKGCFLIYQIWLILFFFGTIGVAVWRYENVFFLVGSLYLAIFCIKEYHAIRQRRLDKAKQAVIGFKIFFGFLVVMLILLVSILEKERIEEVLVTTGAIFVLFVTTIFGAIQVENTLRKQRNERKNLRKMRKLQQRQVNGDIA